MQFHLPLRRYEEPYAAVLQHCYSIASFKAVPTALYRPKLTIDDCNRNLKLIPYTQGSWATNLCACYCITVVIVGQLVSALVWADPLCFLAGCRIRRLTLQGFGSVLPAVSFVWDNEELSSGTKLNHVSVLCHVLTLTRCLHAVRRLRSFFDVPNTRCATVRWQVEERKRTRWLSFTPSNFDLVPGHDMTQCRNTVWFGAGWMPRNYFLRSDLSCGTSDPACFIIIIIFIIIYLL